MSPIPSALRPRQPMRSRGHAKGAIDILINNAGIARSDVRSGGRRRRALAQRARRQPQRRVLVRAGSFGKHMLAARLRRDRQRGLDVGLHSQPTAAADPITTRPKAAVHQLTRSLAAEWAPRGVRVNAVAPTYIAYAAERIRRQNQRDVPPLDRRHAIASTAWRAGGSGVRRPLSRLRRRQPDDRQHL